MYQSTGRVPHVLDSAGLPPTSSISLSAAALEAPDQMNCTIAVGYTPLYRLCPACAVCPAALEVLLLGLSCVIIDCLSRGFDFTPPNAVVSGGHIWYLDT